MAEYPFRYELVDAGFAGHDIQTFAEYPEIIMRQDSMIGNMGLLLDRAKTFRDLFQELSEYGIAAPDPRFVVSYDKYGTGHAATYIVADRVHGISLKEPGEEVPPDICLQTLDGITQYFKQNVRKGGPMLADLAPFQCIYGSTAQNKTPQTYFVDLDLYAAHYDPNNPEEAMTDDDMVDVLESLCHNLVSHAEYAQQLQERTDIDTRRIVQDIAATVRELPYTGRNDDDLEVLRSCVAAVHAKTSGQ